MIERVAAHGITLTRSSDPWNDYDAAALEIAALEKLGMEVIVNIIYSVSPRHTDEYFASRARQAAAIKPYRICFKDVAGLLTPDRTRTLIPLIQQNIGDVPWSFTPTAITAWRLQLFRGDEARCRDSHTASRRSPTDRDCHQSSPYTERSSVGSPTATRPGAGTPVEEHFTAIADREGHPWACSASTIRSSTGTRCRAG